jgi:hypothetical protein
MSSIVWGLYLYIMAGNVILTITCGETPDRNGILFLYSFPYLLRGRGEPTRGGSSSVSAGMPPDPEPSIGDGGIAATVGRLPVVVGGVGSVVIMAG